MMDAILANKKFLLAGVACLVLVSVISVTVVTVTGGGNGKIFENEKVGQNGDPITFEEFLSGTFSAKYFNGTWWSNTEIQWKDSNGNLVLFDINSGETTILVSSETLSNLGSANFLGFAPNSNTMQLFAANIEPNWRHSTFATYTVLDSSTSQEYPIAPSGLPSDTKLQYANWLPHDVENRIVFVYENNVYVQTDVLNPSSIVQITSDGVVGSVYNGVPDWVYEEEILSTNNALYASQSGSKLAFARFDDTEVEEFHYTKYGDPSDPYGNQYPEEIRLKYPKVGTSNPLIQLKVKDLNNLGLPTVDVIPPGEVLNAGEYIYTAASWSNDVLNVIWMNRVQNQSVVSECRGFGGDFICVSQYELQEPNGWLDLFQPPMYKSTGDELLQIQSGLVGANLHYFQVAKITNNGNNIEFLTNEEFSVTSILGWDETNSIIYFLATGINTPAARQLYSVEDTNPLTSTCITCDLTMPGPGETCQYSSISMSPDFQHYVQTCRGPDIPEVVVRATSDNSIRHVLQDNAELKDKLIPKAIPNRVYLTEDNSGYKSHIRMIMPLNYDVNLNYPALVDVYGGPGYQDVTYRWSIGWADYLTTNYDVIYISIDGRGSGYQSTENMFEVYRNLGVKEMDDQISMMQQLQQQYSFIDEQRTGVWGWSYGGFASTSILTRDVNNVFACGIAVAPVTNWLFYDSVYTERYMGLPSAEDNMAGYNNSNLMSKVEQLRGKKYQLNHGVADDNVHYQQSMFLIKALELADVQFDQQSYPDENHGLNHVSRFLYHSFDNFWSDCLGYTVA